MNCINFILRILTNNKLLLQKLINKFRNMQLFKIYTNLVIVYKNILIFILFLKLNIT